MTDAAKTAEPAEKPLAEVFTQARALIEKPEAWIKGRLTDGSATSVEDATCFCVWGALMRVAPYVPMSRLAEDFQDSAGVDCLPGWNDDPTTTHADVLAAFDRAIAYAQERGL